MSGRSSYMMSAKGFGNQYQMSARAVTGQQSSVAASSFYGNLVEQAFGPGQSSNSRQYYNNPYYGGSSGGSNGNRNIDRQRTQNYEPSNNGHASRKRTYEDMRECHSKGRNSSGAPTSGPLDAFQPRKRVKKNANDTDSQCEDSGMEDDEGGSSQDKLESDFIDDTCEEQIVHKKKRVLKKGQIDSSEEEEFGERSGKHSPNKKRAQNSKNNKKVAAPPSKKKGIIHEDESEEEKKEEEVKLKSGGADEMKDDEEDEDDEDPYPKLTNLAEG